MTREEVINVLNDYDINFERNTAKEVAEAHEMAIKALEQQPSENEKIIRISKGTLKARTGKYVIYDVEWLKTHFNTTEAKIYGQPNEDYISRKAVLDALHSKFVDGFDGDKWWNSTHVLDVINKAPSVNPQPSERTEERTETHGCDCISRKDIGLTNLEILMCNGDYKEALKMLLDKIEKAPSVTPQQKTGHWVLSGGYWRCSECKEKALLKLDKATGGYREYDPVRSKYCPECGAKMQEMQE